MLVIIPDILSQAELQTINAKLRSDHFLDGRLTAGPKTAKIKANLQTDVKNDATRELQDMILAALMRHSTFVTVAAPKRILPVRFNLYKQGMYYGDHVDNAIMGGVPGEPDRVRVDLSFTLFISPPESYDGGELIIKSGYGRQAFKLPAGQLVVYPTYFYHEVTPVTRGERLACVSWLQSMIRSPMQRELILDLSIAAQAIASAGRDPNARAAAADLIDKVQKNLLRMWIEN
jgi:PKHD-type hydroxylase